MCHTCLQLTGTAGHPCRAAGCDSGQQSRCNAQPEPADGTIALRQKRTPIMTVDCVEGSVVSSRLGYCQACDCGRRVAAVEDVRCDGWKTCQVASHGLPELDVARVRRWCDERVPDAVRDQVRVECEVAPRYLTIVECRPPWHEDMGTKWTRFPIARLRYSRGSRSWALYWRDRNLRFHVYDRVAPSSGVEELLQEIGRDPTAIFWG